MRGATCWPPRDIEFVSRVLETSRGRQFHGVFPNLLLDMVLVFQHLDVQGQRIVGVGLGEQGAESGEGRGLISIAIPIPCLTINTHRMTR